MDHTSAAPLSTVIDRLNQSLVIFFLLSKRYEINELLGHFILHSLLGKAQGCSQ